MHIGKNCVLGHRCVIADNCKILDNSVLAPDTVMSPFTVFGGRPAVYIGELPESFDKYMIDLTVNFYKNFRPNPATMQPQQPQSARGPQDP